MYMDLRAVHRLYHLAVSYRNLQRNREDCADGNRFNAAEELRIRLIKGYPAGK